MEKVLMIGRLPMLGKSTAAALIASRVGARVIHLDGTEPPETVVDMIFGNSTFVSRP